MEISVRSHLTAGMAAVVGATAIGLAPASPAPVLRAAELPASVVAEIALTGTSIPWETIAAVVQAISTGGSLQAGLTSLISSIGTEFVQQALPVITAAAGDVVKYVGVALAELLSGPDAPQIDFEAIIAAATEAINAGNVPGAVQALVSGLSDPLTQIGQVLFTDEFQTFVFDKVGSVIGALPEILRAAVQTVVGIDIKPLIDALSGLLGGILPGASVVAAPRALAAVPRALAASSEELKSSPAEEPESAPDSDGAPAGNPAAEASPEVSPAAKDASPANKDAEGAETPADEPTEALVKEAPVEEAPVKEATEAPVEEAPVEVEGLESVTSQTSASGAESADPAPAGARRTAKSGPRGHAAGAKSASSRAAAGAGRG